MLGESLICGLLLTKDWRKCLELLNSIKVLAKPSTFVYSAIIGRAINDEDENIFWTLLKEMVSNCEFLPNEPFTSYISFCEKNSRTFTENINKMLTFIEENEILVSNGVVNEFQSAFQRFGYTSTISSITKQ